MSQDEYPYPYALTHAEVNVLKRALTRPPEYFVCPTPGLWGAAQTIVLRNLRKDGFIDDRGSPGLTAKGQALAAKLTRLEREAAERSQNYVFSKGPPELPPVSAAGLAKLERALDMLVDAQDLISEAWETETGVRTPRLGDATLLIERGRAKLDKEINLHKKGAAP
jgi:hypothetical protein